MAVTYGVVADPSVELTTIDDDKLREQLEGIVGVVEPMFEGQSWLDQVEVAMTVSAEGQLAFLVKATIEASIKLTFKRPE